MRFALAIALLVKSYAQELVDRTAAANQGLLVIAMHVSTEGAGGYPIIASNIGRIGKPADEDDLRVVETGKTNLEVAHGGTRFEVEMPLTDSAGARIGALGLVFRYRAGQSKTALEKKAIGIRDALARHILDAASLAEPFPAEPLATTKAHAQKLVDATFAAHRELTLLALYAKNPKGGDASLIASSFGGIGRKPGEAEAQVLAGGAAQRSHERAVVPLLDAAGKPVGALDVSGGDEKTLLHRAEKLRDELCVPAAESLFELDP